MNQKVKKQFQKESVIIQELKKENEYWKGNYSKILDAYFELHKYRKLYNENVLDTDKKNQ